MNNNNEVFGFSQDKIDYSPTFQRRRLMSKVHRPIDYQIVGQQVMNKRKKSHHYSTSKRKLSPLLVRPSLDGEDCGENYHDFSALERGFDYQQQPMMISPIMIGGLQDQEFGADSMMDSQRSADERHVAESPLFATTNIGIDKII